MRKLILQIVAGIIGIWLATIFVSGVKIEIIPGQSGLFGIELTAGWQMLILVGVCLGLVNFFIKPVLNVVTLPIRVITLGTFALGVNAILVLIIDILFPELIIEGLKALILTTIIIWVLSFLLPKFYNPKK